tara:strand:- start:7421 stop:7738 length:318 start_codon:yes stop_codon:yes gene_type:complete
LYLIRRIFQAKPGAARKVAILVHKQAQIYHDAGQRGEFRVAYNGNTMPGEQDVVVLEWADEAIQSPMRAGNALPAAALEVGAEVRPLIEGSRIEFMELLTPDQVT